MKLCFINKIYEKNNSKLKNIKKMDKLSPTMLVRSYSFADIMTRGKHVALKIVACSRAEFSIRLPQFIVISLIFV